MKWLDTLLKSRGVEGERVQIFYDLLTTQLTNAFSPDEAKPLLQFLEEAKNS
jgi:hypothetical protein